jgi:hypothetical protein
MGLASLEQVFYHVSMPPPLNRLDEPISLPAAALGSDAVVESNLPIPALAWVLHHDGFYRQVEATATAWTRHAVRIRWTDQFGKQQAVWVWAQAVRGR